MVEEDEAAWPRRDLGNDEDAWSWALGQVGASTVIPLATHGAEGPRVRPVTAITHGGRVYVLTGTRDAKVRDLAADPRFEFYVLVEEGERTGYARFRGTARMVEAHDLRRDVADASGFAEDYFEGPDDPLMTIVWLDIDQAELMRPGARGYELLSR